LDAEQLKGACSAFMCRLYVSLDTFEAAELERRLRGFR
jgi:hypothetical protein